MDFMKQYKDETYALLRIVSGFLFIFHGIPKMSAICAGTANWMTMIAGPIEVIGGLMIMVGLIMMKLTITCVPVLASFWIHPIDILKLF